MRSQNQLIEKRSYAHSNRYWKIRAGRKNQLIEKRSYAHSANAEYRSRLANPQTWAIQPYAYIHQPSLSERMMVFSFLQ